MIRGPGGNDIPFGSTGNDQLFGQAGNEQLRGGPGNDTLTGGAAAGDQIMLGAIDANQATAANDAFVLWVGRVWLTKAGTSTLAHARTGGDPTHDLVFPINDSGVRAAQYTAADFIL